MFSVAGFHCGVFFFFSFPLCLFFLSALVLVFCWVTLESCQESLNRRIELNVDNTGFQTKYIHMLEIKPSQEPFSETSLDCWRNTTSDSNGKQVPAVKSLTVHPELLRCWPELDIKVQGWDGGDGAGTRRKGGHLRISMVEQQEEEAKNMEMESDDYWSAKRRRKN